MKPKFDPDSHEDSPPLTAEFMAGVRPAREIHGDEWVDRAMGRKGGPPKRSQKPLQAELRAMTSPAVKAE